MDESWSTLSTLSGPALADLGTIRAVATAGEPGEIFLSGKSQIPLRYLVTDRSEAGRAFSELKFGLSCSSPAARASRSATSLGSLCDQIAWWNLALNNARLFRFPIGQISWNLHTRRWSVSRWKLLEQNYENFPIRGRFSPQTWNFRPNFNGLRRQAAITPKRL